MEEVEGGFYSKLCKKVGNIFPLRVYVGGKLEEKISFCGLPIRSYHVLNTFLFFLIISILLSIPIIYFSTQIGLFVLMGGIAISSYLFFYPYLLAWYYRVVAPSDLLLALLYLISSLKLTPNLEKGIQFAAYNTPRIIGRDLKFILWQILNKRIKSGEEGLKLLAKKYQEECKEFTEAINIVLAAQMKGEKERVKMYEEAIEVMIERGSDRMKEGARKARSGISIITYMGIFMPAVLISMVPILTLFMGNTIGPTTIIIIYNIALPFATYVLLTNYIKSLPISFSTINVSQSPDAIKFGRLRIRIGRKKSDFFFIFLPLLIPILTGYVGYNLIKGVDIYNGMRIVGGCLILGGIVFSTFLILYPYYSHNLKIYDRIRKTEDEFIEALFQLGMIMRNGIPLESAMIKLKERIGKYSEARRFFGYLLERMQTGRTLKESLFDERIGVVNWYPSELIRNVSKIFAESTKKGTISAADTLLTVSSFLKTARRAEEYTKEVMNEITSELSIMQLLLLPVFCGMVVGISGIIGLVLKQITESLKKLTGMQTFMPTTMFLPFETDVRKMVPLEIFTLSLGFYGIEMLVVICSFIAALEWGNETFRKLKLITESWIRYILIFAPLSIIIYIAMSGLIKWQ